MLEFSIVCLDRFSDHRKTWLFKFVPILEQVLALKFLRNNIIEIIVS